MHSRVLNLTWSKTSNSSKTKVLRLLLREYLRRSSLWASHLKVEWSPFNDIAYHIDKSKRADTTSLSNIEFPNVLVKKTCELILQWDLVKDSEAVKNLNLPDPFEPLLKFYERGGSIYYEAASLVIDSAYGEIGTCKLDRSLYLKQAAIVNLDDAILDALDSEE